MGGEGFAFPAGMASLMYPATVEVRGETTRGERGGRTDGRTDGSAAAGRTVLRMGLVAGRTPAGRPPLQVDVIRATQRHQMDVETTMCLVYAANTYPLRP